MTSPVPVLDLILRIAAGAVLGGVIGYERDLHGRPVGLRTHVLVALASATFMAISAHFAFHQGYSAAGMVEVDGSRIAGSVVSGIGFLAGGAILRTGVTIQGLTTAAGLWLVTAIGLAAGGGMYWIALAVTAMGMLALTVLRRFEDKDGGERHRVSIVVGLDTDMTAIVRDLSSFGVVVAHLEYERRLDRQRAAATFDVALPREVPLARVLAALESAPDVRRIRVRRP